MVSKGFFSVPVAAMGISYEKWNFRDKRGPDNAAF